MKNPLFDACISDPATTPDPFSSSPLKELKDEKQDNTKGAEPKEEEELQTFAQYY